MKIESIELDSSIQCRSAIDTATVGEYAERMEEGDIFPPVVLFGDSARCWIGDGWHRVLAARQAGFEDIPADVRKGGRRDALQYALGANASNGMRRTNADKRRCVEIALKEFGGLSSRAIADMCGVSNHIVDSARLPLGENPNATRTTTDGRQYPSHRTDPQPQERKEMTTTTKTTEHTKKETQKITIAPPSNGMQFVRMAILDMEKIRADDTERELAFETIKEWIEENENA